MPSSLVVGARESFGKYNLATGAPLSTIPAKEECE